MIVHSIMLILVTILWQKQLPAFQIVSCEIRVYDVNIELFPYQFSSALKFILHTDWIEMFKYSVFLFIE